MQEELLRLCLERGILLDKEISDILSKLDLGEVELLIRRISSQFGEKIITKSFFNKNQERIAELAGENKKIIEKISLGLHLEITREKLEQVKPEKKEPTEIFRNIRIIRSIKDESKKIEIADFIKHFRNRFSFLRSILQDRMELENLVSINKVSNARQAVSIIGMVYEKRITKNKNILIGLEDLTGKITIIVNQNKPEVFEIAKNVILDDVIAVKGTGDREIIFVNNIFYPDARLPERKKLDRDESAVFISDLHVGSRMFLEDKLLKFISWVNGEVGDEEQKKQAMKVKYIFITGDVVDGVGTFPGQEQFLDIKDIREQYKKTAELLARIRKDILLIICPGQHDSVYVAEPQPAIKEDYAQSLLELENVVAVSNPALIEICNDFGSGLKILMYHGASFHYFISEIESLRFGGGHNAPAAVVKEVLKRRHLASLHGSVTYTPNGVEDRLVIREVPDIIATADLHKPEVDLYNNILIVCSSCWQTITPFEEKVGNHPDPCKVIVLNLKTRQVKILDFSDEEENKKTEKECEEKSGEECEEKQGEMVCGRKNEN